MMMSAVVARPITKHALPAPGPTSRLPLCASCGPEPEHQHGLLMEFTAGILMLLYTNDGSRAHIGTFLGSAAHGGLMNCGGSRGLMIWLSADDMRAAAPSAAV